MRGDVRDSREAIERCLLLSAESTIVSIETSPPPAAEFCYPCIEICYIESRYKMADASPSYSLLTPSMLHILLALGEGPRHGYAIMQAVEERTRGRMRLGPGNLYGSIKRLLADGLIRENREASRREAEAKRRRVYELTERGRRIAALESERLRDLVEWARAGRLLKPARPPQRA
jgi:DNA-binding PadR family transcriptional regulator